VVAEPPLLCLAVCGLTLAFRDHRRRLTRTTLTRVAVAAGAVALGAAQSISILGWPDHPMLFERPLAASGPARVLSAQDVRATASQIRRCSPGAAYDGPPYLAFVAHRQAAGRQPDQFIIQNAPVLSHFRRRVALDFSVCVVRGSARRAGASR
jgi:hypothetical protein